MNHNELKVTVFGEIMMTRRISIYEHQEFLDLIKMLRETDVTLTNIEGMGMSNFKGYRFVGTGGTPMTGESFIADELQWAGFNLVTLANNHTMDYGEEGLLSGIRELDRVGIVHAGAGRNLTEAREPRYLETKKGRIALISFTQTYMQLQPQIGLHTMATAMGKGWRGRPGINPLRYEAAYTVTKNTRKELETLDFLGCKGTKVTIGSTPTVQYTLFKQDYEGILREIKEAKRQADWVIASNHTHDTDPRLSDKWGKVTVEYLRDFYKECIDAGADVLYGHGDHSGQGIEIYKGKPIFYSLASPICSSSNVRRLPIEEYERYGLGYNSTPTDWMNARNKASLDRYGEYASNRWLQTVMALVKIDGWHGKLNEMKLIPIDSSADKQFHMQNGGFAHRGVVPVIVKGAKAQKIIHRYAKMSEPFGTNIEFKDGIGVVTV